MQVFFSVLFCFSVCNWIQIIFHRLMVFFVICAQERIIGRHLNGPFLLTANFRSISRQLMSYWMFAICSTIHRFLKSKSTFFYSFKLGLAVSSTKYLSITVFKLSFLGIFFLKKKFSAHLHQWGNCQLILVRSHNKTVWKRSKFSKISLFGSIFK